MDLQVIAHIKSDFPTKFAVPRQSGLVEELVSYIVFEPKYRDENALKGIEDFSHIWLIWAFSENTNNEEWSPTVRPPRLGGNKRMGVFATRSPNRPNPIGLSLVKIDGIKRTAKEGCVLRVRGADLVDGTPIYDIKPYLPAVDCRQGAVGGFTDSVDFAKLNVNISDEMLRILPENKRRALINVISQDPRPQYHCNCDRVYGFPFAGFEIKFRVDGDTAVVISVEQQ